MTAAATRTEVPEDPIAEREWLPPTDFCPSDGSVVGQLRYLGGVATRAQLLQTHTRAVLEAAVRAGEVTRAVRGRYVLPETDAARALAHQYGGVLCLRNAALHHGWAVKSPPARPDVCFPRRRALLPGARAQLNVRWADLHADDIVDGGVTSRETTLLQCLRLLPFDEALAIADSALRAGEFALLRRVAATVRGAGSARVRRVAYLACPDAANPFESVLRAIAVDVDGLHVVPQRLITSVDPEARPDLVDADLKIVLEADSFEWHGHLAQLIKDARRYNALVADGWLVLRFVWVDVMFHHDVVRRQIDAVVALRARGWG